ncbi:DUF721 domain-containing protein [bacterium]|nr:DUF721 domain-containing protein [bacterium]PIV80996.1 MAG: hypothetical protein COW53_06760 [bacterium CG17_big_fil_post_rev_8_21_14_2_50_64_8]PJA75840.1 MAG: hypothetical protein CO151_04755 [bacterium CG_4_9_14_3_um_filter_65_15]
MSSSADDRKMPGGLRPISGAVGEALRSLGLEDRFRERAVLAHWEEAVGPDIAAHVKALDIEDGVLVLMADHGAWRQEVNMLADRIIAELNAREADRPVRELRWSNRPGRSGKRS